MWRLWGNDDQTGCSGGGKVYAYYICSRHAVTKACAAHRIPMGKLEETVLENVVKIHIENILDMKKIMDFIHEVPFQELDIKELEIRKEAKEKEAVRCRELRDYLYEDFREGIISKEDYKELHDGYTEKRKKAEEAVRSIDQQISEVLESKSDKYHWLDYFAEHQNIQELTKTVAVELIDQILVYDKKHIEVRFNFDDCYQSLLRQIQSVGMRCQHRYGRKNRNSKEGGRINGSKIKKSRLCECWK